MQIFNTMSRQKESLVPLEPGKVGIYVCGPTVYNYIHIGNSRPLCVFDTLRRYLEYRGYRVRFVSNITDIDDKMIRLAAEEGVTVTQYGQKYARAYLEDMDGLNVRRPDVIPYATEHIPEIIAMVTDILAGGYGYVARNGDVYFRARRFEQYGRLSHLVLDDLENNRRLASEMDADLKENPADFAVWKAAKPGEPAWDSPWGMGRPGWHIECSAMAKKHLGATFDIHGGGQDLIFPHHENEIAQSVCGNHQPFARYWMHNAMLNMDGSKMSKSKGNFFTTRQVAGQVGYEVIRYFMLSAHYRTPMSYSMDILEQCRQGLERLYTCRENLEFALEKAESAGEGSLAEAAQRAEEAFRARMDDDLNTADALAVVFDFVRELNSGMGAASREALQKALQVFNTLCTDVLGLLYSRKKDEIPPQVLALVEERTQVRGQKNWARADAIRGELAAMGYAVEDTPQGPKVVALATQ